MLTLFSLIALLATPAAAVPNSKVTQQSTPIIDVVMVGAGKSFYTAFGHTALLIRPNARTPLMKGQLYNFGVTALGDSDFLLNFLGGRAIFWGNIRPYAKQIKRWQREDRTITRYRLLVAPVKARKLYARFQSMVKPENREFVYDLFRRNCVTKVRDVINEFTDGLLHKTWSREIVRQGTRQLAKIGYSDHPAIYFAFQWFPGRAMDAANTAWFRSGEPSFFEEKLKTLSYPDGRRVVGPPVIDSRRQAPPAVGNPIHWFPISHGILIALLLGLAIFARPQGPRLRALCLGLGALLVGGLGSLLAGIHFWTDWIDLKANLLMLTAWPVDLILLLPAMAMLRGRPTVSAWVKPYIRAHVVLGALLIIAGLMVTALDGPLVPRLVLLSGWLFASSLVSKTGTPA